VIYSRCLRLSDIHRKQCGPVGLDQNSGRRAGVAGSLGTSDEDDPYERIAEKPTQTTDHLMCGQ
jgi:hypothetical protein